jgi:hypothetical protein
MQIAFKKFVQLTAVLAAGGTVIPACSASDAEENNSTGGKAGASSTPSGPAASGAAGAADQAKGGAAGETGSPATEGGASSQAGAAGETGSPATEGGASSQAGAAGETGSPATEGGASSQAGAAGATTAGPTGEGGASHQGGAAGEGGARGPGGASGLAGAGTCTPAGDPVAEGDVGIDCSQLSMANEICDSPSGEGGTAPYGVQLCNAYAYEPQTFAQALFDCVDALTAPAAGWCGDDHLGQADACLAQVEQQTCKTDAADAACASINVRCSDVAKDDCVADLSPRSEDFVASVEPCMEGFGGTNCALDYRACLGLPERYVETAGVCSALAESCDAITTDVCTQGLDYYETGYVYENQYLSVEACMAAAVEQGSPCDEAFTSCAGA